MIYHYHQTHNAAAHPVQGFMDPIDLLLLDDQTGFDNTYTEHGHSSFKDDGDWKDNPWNDVLAPTDKSGVPYTSNAEPMSTNGESYEACLPDPYVQWLRIQDIGIPSYDDTPPFSGPFDFQEGRDFALHDSYDTPPSYPVLEPAMDAINSVFTDSYNPCEVAPMSYPQEEYTWPIQTRVEIFPTPPPEMVQQTPTTAALGHSKAISIPKPRKRLNASQKRPTRWVRPYPATAISDGAATPPPKSKGRAKGSHLPEDQRISTNHMRSIRACWNCNRKRVKCSIGSPCEPCIKTSRTDSSLGPCRGHAFVVSLGSWLPTDDPLITGGASFPSSWAWTL